MSQWRRLVLFFLGTEENSEVSKKNLNLILLETYLERKSTGFITNRL